VTIRKGEPWGQPGVLPPDAPVARSDAELARLIADAVLPDPSGTVVGLLGGDLCRTVGGTGDPRRLHAGGVVLPIDVGVARFDDGTQVRFVAHLVARNPWWLGEGAVLMNAQWLGPWDLGPRSHPNDGLADVTTGRLPWGDRAEARRRARTGTHLPHPDLRTARASEHVVELPRPVRVFSDGVRLPGRHRRLIVEVIPDAISVVV
jgi:hypothetical protein